MMRLFGMVDMMKLLGVFLLAQVWTADAVSRATGQAGQPVEDQHFMANTYGFLRSTSDSVGQAVGSVLQIQNNLDEMKKDLASEYSMWEKKKQGLTAENERLRSEIARLAAAKQEQHNEVEEGVRLERELAFHKAESEKAEKETADARKRWAAQKASLLQDIKKLEAEIDYGQKIRGQKAAAASTKTSEIRSQNLKLQQQIFDLNQEVLKLQQTASRHRLDAGQKRSEVLAKIDDEQARIRSLQQQLVEQAKRRQSVQRARQQAAAQVEQTGKQREELQRARTECDTSVRQLEGQVAVAKTQLVQANKHIQECQAIDAENQGLQTKLNQCNAMKKSIR